MKKGQGMPLNVIIIAILVLIVLVVLVLIFTGKSAAFGKDTQKTQDAFAFGNCEIPGTGRVCQTGPCASADRSVVGATCPSTGGVAQNCCDLS